MAARSRMPDKSSSTARRDPDRASCRARGGRGPHRLPGIGPRRRDPRRRVRHRRRHRPDRLSLRPELVPGENAVVPGTSELRHVPLDVLDVCLRLAGDPQLRHPRATYRFICVRTGYRNRRRTWVRPTEQLPRYTSTTLRQLARPPLVPRGASLPRGRASQRALSRTVERARSDAVESVRARLDACGESGRNIASFSRCFEPLDGTRAPHEAGARTRGRHGAYDHDPRTADSASLARIPSKSALGTVWPSPAPSTPQLSSRPHRQRV
jgi:hypothetical protein